jgi:hypothetical protein
MRTLMDWLHYRKDRHLKQQDGASDCRIKSHHGTKARVFKEVIDYINREHPDQAMRLLYNFHAEGVYFSRNGAKAYKRGEKPRFMWPNNANLVPTVAHHIARKHTHGRSPGGFDYSRELVMFYLPETPLPPSPPSKPQPKPEI